MFRTLLSAVLVAVGVFTIGTTAFHLGTLDVVRDVLCAILYLCGGGSWFVLQFIFFRPHLFLTAPHTLHTLHTHAHISVFVVSIWALERLHR